MMITRRPALDAVRFFMLLEAASFVAASLIHSGVFIVGYQHHEASVAEEVIAIVLFVGLALTWVRPAWARGIGLAAQAFALLGTLVGILTIVIGIGPRTAPDLIYHAGIVAVLVWGLYVTTRAHPEVAGRHT